MPIFGLLVFFSLQRKIRERNRQAKKYFPNVQFRSMVPYANHTHSCRPKVVLLKLVFPSDCFREEANTFVKNNNAAPKGIEMPMHNHTSILKGFMYTVSCKEEKCEQALCKKRKSPKKETYLSAMPHFFFCMGAKSVFAVWVRTHENTNTCPVEAKKEWTFCYLCQCTWLFIERAGVFLVKWKTEIHHFSSPGLNG